MKRLFVYVWASPATLLGLPFVLLAWFSGGRVHVFNGVIEICGGLVTRFLQDGMFLIGSAGAMTLGHVVLAQDENCLVSSRQHERVHVAQYERWGPLMLPLYLIFCLTARLRGGHAYFDNRFEREAFGKK